MLVKNSVIVDTIVTSSNRRSKKMDYSVTEDRKEENMEDISTVIKFILKSLKKDKRTERIITKEKTVTFVLNILHKLKFIQNRV